jgi:hypothetical protein
MIAMPLGTPNYLPETLQAALVVSRARIVLIEPTGTSLPDHRFLLSNDSYRVTPVSSTRELAFLIASEPFALAVISDTLGRVGLEDASRSVRKQWPSARILVLGRAAFVLDDHLYDDALPQSCSHQELCDILAKMFSQRPNGRPFIVTTPAAERGSQQRLQVSSADGTRLPDIPERMSQMRF